jgi:hypothetical protein
MYVRDRASVLEACELWAVTTNTTGEPERLSWFS